MSKNRHTGPRNGAEGQSQTCSHGEGGYNKPATPFGAKMGGKAKPTDPNFGVAGQRLAGGPSGGKATGYPPGYTSR